MFLEVGNSGFQHCGAFLEHPNGAVARIAQNASKMAVFVAMICSPPFRVWLVGLTYGALTSLGCENLIPLLWGESVLDQVVSASVYPGFVFVLLSDGSLLFLREKTPLYPVYVSILRAVSSCVLWIRESLLSLRGNLLVPAGFAYKPRVGFSHLETDFTFNHSLFLSQKRAKEYRR